MLLWECWTIHVTSRSQMQTLLLSGELSEMKVQSRNHHIDFHILIRKCLIWKRACSLYTHGVQEVNGGCLPKNLKSCKLHLMYYKKMGVLGNCFVNALAMVYIVRLLVYISFCSMGCLNLILFIVFRWKHCWQLYKHFTL